MLRETNGLLFILLFLANTALAGSLAFGGYYVFGYPAGTMDMTEETVDFGVRTYNLDSGVKLKYGATNFGVGLKYQLFDMIGIGVEGSAEYHMGYKNEACTISGTTEYQGQSSPYTRVLEADEMELQSILLNVGVNYSPRLIGIFRPFFGGGFTYSLNKLYELDDAKIRSDAFDKGNCPGFYGQAGLELSMAHNYSVYVPIKYSYYMEGSYERQIQDGSGGGLEPVTDYKMKMPPMLYFGIGIYYIPL
jgi:hypothetical protein